MQRLKERRVKHLIALSANPIKNNSGEYYPILNLLGPELFPSKESFELDHLDYYVNEKGVAKRAGLRNPEAFKELTKDFIIRRTRKEVLPDLPSVIRDYQYYKMESEVQKAYNAGVKKLDTFLKTEPKNTPTFNHKLKGHIMVLWHITGLSKTIPITDYIQTFLDSTENGEKLAIFHHHIDVGDVFESKFKELGIPSIRIIASKHKPEDRDGIIEEFRRNPEIRFFIGPTLACGEGVDIDFVEKAILAEREWNPANEEQVEGRFIRATAEAVRKAVEKGPSSFTMVYPTAIGTIDEFFSETVERKRQYCSETMEGKRLQSWNEAEVMLQIAKRAVEGLN